MKTLRTIPVFMAMALMLVACGEEKKKAATDAMEETEKVVTEEVIEKIEASPNIVEVAAGNDNFSTLVAAVQAAGLVETLSGDGPFTVFAPTNDAFGKLPDGTVDGLLKPESKDALTGILTYHVVSGSYDATAVVDAITGNNGSFTVTTVQGNDITLSITDGNVTLTDAAGGTATVVIPDVDASNGIIHAIDAVVMPE